MKKNRWMIIIGLAIFCICLPVTAKQKEMTVNRNNKNGCTTSGNSTADNITITCDFGTVDAKEYDSIHLDGEGAYELFNEDSISINGDCPGCFSGDSASQSQKTLNINQETARSSCLKKLCLTKVSFTTTGVVTNNFSVTKVKRTYILNFNLTYTVEHRGGGGSFDDQNPDETSEDITCEGIFSDELMDFLVDALKVVKILVPLLIIVLGSADLLRNVFAGKDEDMKKGWNRLFKRFIFGLLVYVLIYIVQVLFPITNDYIGGCLDNFDE